MKQLLRAYVLGLLCKPGPKTLDRRAFEEHAALPEPSAAIRASLELLSDALLRPLRNPLRSQEGRQIAYPSGTTQCPL